MSFALWVALYLAAGLITKKIFTYIGILEVEDELPTLCVIVLWPINTLISVLVLLIPLEEVKPVEKQGEQKPIIPETIIENIEYRENFRCLICGEINKETTAKFCLHCWTPYHVGCYASVDYCVVYGCKGRTQPKAEERFAGCRHQLEGSHEC